MTIDPNATPDQKTPDLPKQSVGVFDAQSFRVTHGVNRTDPIGPAPDLELADVYQLSSDAERARLSIEVGDDQLYVANDSDVGTAKARLFFDSCVTFMSERGGSLEALVVIETDDEGHVENCYFLPLSEVSEETDYTLVDIDTENARARLAEIAYVAFTRGTHITMADGIQTRIEDLNVGDRVLTRYHGAQKIQWIGQQTVRATGALAPIVIRQGTLNNAHDLVLSPNHRLFIYQRSDKLNAGRAEILVKAGLLVNGRDVVQSDGGFVDYFQLLFDNHEIIYAEGIAAESMFVDSRIRPFLPAEVSARLDPAHSSGPKGGTRRAVEIVDGELSPETATDILRAASRG
ncbi:hypothetical protein GCM10022404_21400 [Celeribacter arenosi]|uniref:Hedgehog/Intein (Hint) domain-containing protein n=1 Tax=Celeribacter arenosi TaxID=792649 RepID=A0ABP7KAN5_9RHOB